MNNTSIGILIGVLLGVAWAAGGFSGFLLAAFLGTCGMVAARAIGGEVDLNAYVRELSGKRPS